MSSSINAAAPTVIGSIFDQEALEGELFSMSFDIYEVFSDADNDGLSIEIKKDDDSALPTWLTLAAKSLVPSLVGIYDTSDSALGVTVVGNYAYIADGLSGLQIIDISTPSSPSLVGTYDTSGQAQEVMVVGDYAYIADELSLEIIDISTPSSPSLVGTYDTSDVTRGVTIVGNYAYVATINSGLKIINVSTPSSPSLVGTYDTSGQACKVTVVGDYAYVADATSGLKIIGDIREGIQLTGTPTDSDLEVLNLKATASDSADEVSTTFSIDVNDGDDIDDDVDDDSDVDDDEDDDVIDEDSASKNIRAALSLL